MNLLQDFGRWITEAGKSGAAFDVVFSSRLVRFAVVPWDETAVTSRDQETLAKMALESVTDGAMTDWQIRLGPQRFGCARLVCAVRQNILENLQSVVSSAGARLGSMRPLMQYAVNKWLRMPPDENFISLCIENDHVMAMSFNERNLGWVRHFSQLDGDAKALIRSIDRQKFLVGGSVASKFAAVQFGRAIDFSPVRNRVVMLEQVAVGGENASAIASMAAWSEL
ncbi:MAG TPA: hypothetical protein VFW00_06210 [Rhodocyclaceae bacterium]|nr:hypothetical protein [Rhodocyclaceae bacterium]